MNKCPYCKAEIELGTVVVACDECGSPYHLECWNSDEGCAVYGCQGRIASENEGRLTRVYTAPLLPQVQHVMNLLELSGIACSMTNQYLAAAAGEIPPTECWPQVWVWEKDRAKADDIIENLMSGDEAPAPIWVCPKCGEKLEGQFTECWNCGTSRQIEETDGSTP